MIASLFRCLTRVIALAGAAMLAGGIHTRAQVGEKLWEFEADTAIRNSPVLTSDGGIHFGTTGGRLYALKPTGAKRWTFAGTGSFQGSPAVGAEDTIYIGSTSGRFYALSSGGTLQWSWMAGGPISSTPAVAPGGTIYVASEDHTVTALSPEGVPLWAYRAEDDFEASPVIASDGTVYASSRDGRFHAIHPDGSSKWITRLNQVSEAATAIGAGGVLYIGGGDSRLRAVSPDGERLWEVVTDRKVASGPAIGPDGTVYFLTSTARGYAVRPDGTKLWSVSLPAAMGYSSPAISADGGIHFGALDGRLYALNSDGSIRWSFDSSNRIAWSSPVLAPDGRVYVGADDGKLYALRGSAGLAASAWPMFQRDARHSASGFVERELPEDYSPGLELGVALVSTPDAGVRLYTVEDTPPNGWQVGEIEANGSFDAVNRRVRFGPFLDGKPRVLRYRVTPPSTETGTRSFVGTSSANGAERLVGGHQVVNHIPLHPADRQPVDGWLTVDELTAYGTAWKRGTAWPLAPTPIPSAYLARAAHLWLNGEAYGYDTNFATAPQWWTAPARPPPQAGPPPSPPVGLIATNGQAVASAPIAYRAGQPHTVAIRVTPASNVVVYAVEDQPPSGWEVTVRGEGGGFDSSTGKVKWGPFFDATARTLSYEVVPPATATNIPEFHGVAAFDGARVEVLGQRVLQPSATGWPDEVARRQLPDGYTPGVKIVVTIRTATLGASGTTLRFEDHPPNGWTIGAISPGGVYDPIGHVVRFGPFVDGLPGTSTYELTPPARETGVRQFYGTFNLEGVPGLMTGDATLDLIPLHPADLQVTDGWMTIGEITAYSAAWKRGTAWPVNPTSVPDDYLGQAIMLWQNGEAYRHDTHAGTAPSWWTSVPNGATPSSPQPARLPAGTSATNGMAYAEMSPHQAPGALALVKLTVIPNTNVTVYAVEDTPPDGWMVVLGNGSPAELLRGKVRWGPFFDSQPRVLTYQALVPVTAAGLADFHGVAAFDGTRGEIGGQRTLAIREGGGALAERGLPPAYLPGAEMRVTIRTAVPAGSTYYVIEDTPPLGWVVGQVSVGGAYDSQNRKVKFGPFLDGVGRTNTYELTPPVGESGRKFFGGFFLADDVEGLIGGENSLDSVPLLHPADIQWADQRLSLIEVTAYGAAWRRGTAWPVAPARVPTTYLTRASVLWREGEWYAIDPAATTAPYWWVPSTNVWPADAPAPAGATTTNGTATVLRPHFCRAGEPITVRVTVTPAAQVSVYAVEDQVPAGWTVAATQIDGGGLWDAAQRKVKWGPFFDANSRVLTYRATPEREASEISTFAGGAAFDGAAADLAGRRRVFRTDGELVDQFKLTLMSWQEGVGAQLRLDGVAGEVYSVLASPDFESWFPLATLTNTMGTSLFNDRTATNQMQRTYRALWP